MGKEAEEDFKEQENHVKDFLPVNRNGQQACLSRCMAIKNLPKTLQA